MPDGKVGAKKRIKLEMKAQKRKEREVIFYINIIVLCFEQFELL